MQMFYGFAKENDYFKSKVTTSVALAPCSALRSSNLLGELIKIPVVAKKAYTTIVKLFKTAGVAKLFSPDADSKEDKEAICEAAMWKEPTGKAICAVLKVAPHLAKPVSVQLLVHLMQSLLKGQFAEYDPKFVDVEDLDKAKQRSELVPLQKINGPDIHFFVADDDFICPEKDAEWTYGSLKNNSGKTWRVLKAKHTYFTGGGDAKYFPQVLDILRRDEYTP